LIEMRSMAGVAVSAVAAASVAQPDPDVAAVDQHVERTASTCTTFATARSDAVEDSIERMLSAVCGSTR
jgi:endonuclease III